MPPNVNSSRGRERKCSFDRGSPRNSALDGIHPCPDREIFNIRVKFIDRWGENKDLTLFDSSVIYRLTYRRTQDKGVNLRSKSCEQSGESSYNLKP